VYLLVFHAHINEMHGSRSKVSNKKSRPYIYDIKFLALLGAPYIYDISRLRVKKEGNMPYILVYTVFLSLAHKLTYEQEITYTVALCNVIQYH
jgi:hypothetical protein